MSVDKKFLINRQGKDVVLYQGLLDLATDMGLQSIETKIVQIPTEDNYKVAIVIAKVTMKEGKTFTGIGDAAPNNVTPMMLTCLIRMAETRAKARAMRDATNCGVTAFEELGNDEPEPPAQRQRNNLRVETHRSSNTYDADEYGQRPPNVDPDGVIHEGVPSRPALSVMQKAVTDFRAAAAAINPAFGHPSFANKDLRRMVKHIMEDGREETELSKDPSAWAEATDSLRAFRILCPGWDAETTLKAIQFKYQHKLPMVEFTAGMWESPLPPPAAGQSNSGRIDAATMFAAPETSNVG